MGKIKIIKVLTPVIFSIIITAENIIPFKVGETLNYTASFKGIRAAKGELAVLGKEYLDDTDAYHVRFSARTIGITDYIFPINDTVDIWLSSDSLLTIKVLSNIKEGRHSRTEKSFFNHNKKVVISGSDTLSFNGSVHSPYSLFYYFRNKDFSFLQNDSISTFQGGKFSSLELSIEKNIEASVEAGNFICTRITPRLLNKGKFKNDSEMSISFSNDKSRYPVKIKLKMRYGSLILNLDNVIN